MVKMTGSVDKHQNPEGMMNEVQFNMDKNHSLNI